MTVFEPVFQAKSSMFIEHEAVGHSKLLSSIKDIFGGITVFYCDPTLDVH